MRKLRCHPVSDTTGDFLPAGYISNLTHRIRNLRVKNLVCFCLLLTLTLLTHRANAQSAETSLKPKSLRIVNSFITKGLHDGYAALGPDDYIWFGNYLGKLRRFDPATNIVSEHRVLDGGVVGCLGTITRSGKRMVFVGVGSGSYYFFGEDGALVHSSKEQLRTTLAQPPLVDGENLFCLSESGLAFKLDENLRLVRIGNNLLPGAPTSWPSLIKKPYEALVFGTANIGDFITQENQYNLVIDPLDSSRAQLVEILGFKSKKIIKTTAASLPEVDIVLAVNEVGEVFKVDYQGVKKNPIINLNCVPVTAVILLGDGRLALIGNDLKGKEQTDGGGSPVRCLFTIDGRLISRTPLQTFSGETVEHGGINATTVSDQGRLTALIGFQDCYLRLIDVQTGMVLASLKTPSPIPVPPQHLQSTDYYVAEESGPLPDEVTRHYVVRIVDGQ